MLSERQQTIPKEVWEIKEEWNNLGKDISYCQNDFLKALSNGDEGFLEFSYKSLGLIGDLKRLQKRSSDYIKDYQKTKEIDT